MTVPPPPRDGCYWDDTDKVWRCEDCKWEIRKAKDKCECHQKAESDMSDDDYDPSSTESDDDDDGDHKDISRLLDRLPPVPQQNPGKSLTERYKRLVGDREDGPAAKRIRQQVADALVARVMALAFGRDPKPTEIVFAEF